MIRCTAVLIAAAAALTAAGCTTPDVPTRVCGSIAGQPIRVDDKACHTVDAGNIPLDVPPGGVRWWTADPRCLDADDHTAIGEPLDDDYLGEPCDPRHAPTVAPSKKAKPSTKAAAPSRTSKPGGAK